MSSSAILPRVETERGQKCDEMEAQGAKKSFSSTSKKINQLNDINLVWTMVVAQLAERSLPKPEIPSSNPDNGNKIFERNYLSIAIQTRQR